MPLVCLHSSNHSACSSCSWLSNRPSKPCSRHTSMYLSKSCCVLFETTLTNFLASETLYARFASPPWARSSCVLTPVYMTHTQAPMQTQRQTETEQKQTHQAITSQWISHTAKDKSLPATVRASAAHSLFSMAHVFTFKVNVPKSSAAYPSVIDTLVRMLQK